MWTIPEIIHAINNGDRVTQIFEVFAYESYSNYLKEFLDILSSYKIRYSKFPSVSEEELQSMCDQINRDMGFDSPELRLSPERLEDNPQLKDFFKLWSNALLGKKFYKTLKG